MKITKLTATVVLISGLAAGAAVAQAKCCGHEHQGKSCAEAHQVSQDIDTDAAIAIKRDAEAAWADANPGQPAPATSTGAKQGTPDAAGRIVLLDRKDEPRPKIMKLRH